MEQSIQFHLENQTGAPEAHLVQVVEKIPEGKCQVEGCLEGKYATAHHSCDGKGCDSCSTEEKHGIAGRVLCKYCNGEKCENCDQTGLYLRTCRQCNGTGRRLRSIPISRIHRVVVRPESTPESPREEAPEQNRDNAFGALDESALAVLDSIQ